MILSPPAPRQRRWRRVPKPIERSAKWRTRWICRNMCCASGKRAFPKSGPSSGPAADAITAPTTSSGCRLIRRLLYDEGYTIKGVQKLFKEQGVQALSAAALPPDGPSAEVGKRRRASRRACQSRSCPREPRPGLRTTISRRCAKRWPKSWTPNKSWPKRARWLRDALRAGGAALRDATALTIRGAVGV